MHCSLVRLLPVLSTPARAVSTLVLAAPILFAQSTTPPPKAVPSATPPILSASAPDVSKEAYVFDEMTTKIRMEADGTGTRETTVRARILADAGVKQFAVLTFTYTSFNQQIDINYVRVKKPDGSVIVTPDYNTQDMPADVTRDAPMYSDIHQKHVTVRGLSVGDTLEYQTTLRTIKPEVPNQFWLEYTFEKDLITLDEQLDLDVPADKSVTIASADTQPTIATANGRKLYHWVSSNLKRPDPDAPPKSTKNWKPSVQVTTFANWAQVGAWYEALQHDQVKVTPAIQAHADALVKGLTSDSDKLNAIFNDVALHIHYVGLDFGIGRYQPHAADDVLANQYGDCKDKHTLLATMLKAEGITAWPVLISSSRDLDPATPSPAQFDHVITVVPLDGKLLWMDSTEELAPIGTLMAPLRDKQSLAVPVDKAAYLEHTPADLPYLQYVHYNVEGKLSDQGEFTGHFDQTYRGDVELLLRLAFRSVPQSQWKVLVQRFSNATGFGGDVQSPDISPIEAINQPLKIAYDYKREKFGQWDDHRISPPLPPVGWELAPGIEQKKPADDINLGSPGEQVLRANVHLPQGWSMFVLDGVTLKQDWAEYQSTYSFKNGVYAAERRLTVIKDKIPLADWDKYLDFRRAIYNDEVRMSTLFPPTGSSTAQNPQPNNLNAIAESMGGVRRDIVEGIQRLAQAENILDADPPSSTDDVRKADDICTQAVTDSEAKSLQLPPDNFDSLYWPAAIAGAWTCRGWAAFELKDIATAEAYLRAAWRTTLSPVSGYFLARALEARNAKTEAAHFYALASISPHNSWLLGIVDRGDLRNKIEAGYKRVTGHPLNATSLNHGSYNGSLSAELDREVEIRPFTRTSTLTGAGLYALAFEEGKKTKAYFIGGDKGFERMITALESHPFPPMLPRGSKGRLLREVRLICTPYAGCDAYLLLPTEIAMPEIKFRPVTTSDGPNGTKTTQRIIQLQIAPPQ